jgi:hypothetical protein
LLQSILVIQDIHQTLVSCDKCQPPDVLNRLSAGPCAGAAREMVHEVRRCRLNR